MKKHSHTDSLVLIFFLVLAPVVSLLFRTPLLISLLLFYGLPSLWLSIRAPQLVKRSAFFAFLGVLVFFVVDYIAVLDGGWFVSTIFKFRLLGVLPIEDSIWFFFGVYLIVMFYEYFDEHGKHKIEHTKLKYLMYIIALMFLVFFGFILFNPSLLVVHYAYAWIGIVFALIPIITVLSIYPKLRFKFIRANFYMIGLHLPFELVALRLGQWSFPGKHFIGWVQVMGVQFPIEEFLIYILIAGVALLSYYEFYDDDGR